MGNWSGHYFSLMARHSILLFLSFALASPVSAQDLNEVGEPQPGTRVRISFPESSPERSTPRISQLVGTVADWSQDAVLVEASGTEQRIPLDQIEKVEISLGESSNIGTGAWVGALAGLAIGIGAGVACASGEDCAAGTSDAAVILGAGFAIAALGTGIGAGIGAAVKTERWEEFNRSPPAEASVGLGRDGSLTLAFSLRF